MLNPYYLWIPAVYGIVVILYLLMWSNSLLQENSKLRRELRQANAKDKFLRKLNGRD